MGELWGLHARLDNLQSDGAAAEVVVAQQLCAVADGEATLAELRARRILQALRVADHSWRWLCVDRGGGHWAMQRARCVGARRALVDGGDGAGC